MVEALRFAIELTLRLAVAAGFSFLAYRLAGEHKYGLVLVALSSPLWGVLLAKPILGAIGGFIAWSKRQPYAKWQGHYYEFQGTQIRIFEQDDALWFCDRDVLRVLGKAPTTFMKITYGDTDYKHIPEANMMAFSETAVVAVVSRIRHSEAGKLKFWLEREVIAPYHRKLELAGTRAPCR